MIASNVISNAGANGIYSLNNSSVTIGGNTEADANTISNVGQNGILVSGGTNNNVRGNTISNAAYDGIKVRDFGLGTIWIANNDISMTGDDGIDVKNGGFVSIYENSVFGAGFYLDGDNASASGADGIHVLTGFVNRYGKDTSRGERGSYRPIKGLYFLSTSTQVTNNIVDTSSDDGIDIEGVTDVTVGSNDVDNSGDNGIIVKGFAGGFGYSEYDDEVISFGVINEEPGFIASITNNTVNTSGNNGIVAEGFDNLIVTDNAVEDSQSVGILIAGADNGSVTLLGNTLTDNGVGARFESGAIDMSDLSRPNRFINNAGRTSGGTPGIGMVFDRANPEDVTSLSIVGETIGSTIFEGFLPIESFYVRFEDGNILNPVTGLPIVINGLNASFDGIVPASTGGLLTQSQLDFIEARLFDADDALVDGRGQIFVGDVLTLEGLENLEDFFNNFGSLIGNPSGLQITITGLPSVGGPVGGAFGGGAAALNALAPAAGEGSENQDVAEIEPAAGDGENVTCWNDAISSAGNGQTVSYNYGGTFEESLTDAASCGTQAQ